MAQYEVKSWTHFFKAIKTGKKTHDLRDLRDRKYKVGDTLILKEYDPFLGQYTGDECRVLITYITSNETPCAFSSSVLPKDYCILSISLVLD
jgi:ASC-1-like (ASCH) protein